MTFSKETNTNPVNSDNGDLKVTTKSKEVFKKVIDEATFIDGNDGELPHPDDIPWLDKSLVTAARALYHDYFCSYIMSTIICMVTLAVAVKPISTLLFCSDKPLDVHHHFKRFLGKCRGVLKFFDIILDPVEGKKVFYKTRKMHAIAVRRLENVGNGKTLPEMLIRTEEPWMQETADAIKEDMKELEFCSNQNGKIPPEILENLSWEAKVPFSQFGHVYFTTGFFGIVWMQPQLFGMKDRNDFRMRGMIHIWAIIVKMLGLRDEFNIYINPDPEVIDRVVRDVYIHSLKNMDSLVIYLIEVVVQGINNHVPILTVNGCLCLVMRVLGCNKAENLWKIMSTKDKIMYYGIGGLIYLGGTVNFVRRFLNWGFRLLLDSLFVKVLGKYV